MSVAPCESVREWTQVERDAERSVLGRRHGRGQVSSGLTHECGVFGAIASGRWPAILDISQIVCYGLVALQHRGQESAGIVTSNYCDHSNTSSNGINGQHSHNSHTHTNGNAVTGNHIPNGTPKISPRSKHFRVCKGMGLVSNIFTDDDIARLKGNLGIGHTRYSTSAASEALNCQPFVVHTAHGEMAVAHNGELVNCDELREMVLSRGVGLSTHSDSELITQALCLNPPEGEHNGPDWPARIKHLIELAPLSYSLVIMLKDRIYAVRDPFGNRPLCLGKILKVNEPLHEECDERHQAEGWVVASESCGFLSIGAQYVREVFPGEIIEMTRHGIKTVDTVHPPGQAAKRVAFCIFEYVYFARADSIFEGQMVYAVRQQCGRQLAVEHPIEADIVSSVPESGTAAAHGFAAQTCIPFAEVLCKNRYVGRSFIQPSNRLRQLAVNKKFGALSGNVKGKRVVLIDDSIVRGNTIGPIIRLLRNAGAREVHIRIASPPLKYPCYMGINIPTREELVANCMAPKELAKHIGADSLAYMSVEGLILAVRHNMKVSQSSKKGHCTACLTGDYPNGIPKQLEW